MPYPEQRVRLENISSVQGNVVLCEILTTNLRGKLRNNNRCKIVSRSHAVTLSQMNIRYVDGIPVVQKD